MASGLKIDWVTSQRGQDNW